MFLRDLKDMQPRSVNDVFALLAVALAVHVAVPALMIWQVLHAPA